MTTGFRVFAIAAAFLVVGCQSVPEPVVEMPVCAKPEVIECPRCEIFECPVPRVLERVVTQPVPPASPPESRPCTGGKLDLPIIGSIEWVHLEYPGITLEALMDTAVELTVLQVSDIQMVEKDGQQHVLYAISDPGTGESHAMDSPLQRRTVLKWADGSTLRAHIVRLWVTLGETRNRVEVALSERGDMAFPLLVGRNLLTDVAIIDVSQRHTLGTP